MRRILGLLLATGLATLAMAPPAGAFTIFTVDDTGDRPDEVNGDGQCTTDLGPGECTLRAAVEEANALPGNDGINLPAGTYDLTIGVGGALEVTETLVVLGAGARSAIIRQERDDGQGIGDRVFDVQGAATSLTLSDVTIANGWAQPAAGFFGGNIRSVGTLRVIDSTITGGRASSGGGISNVGGTLTVENSTISGNAAPDGGGDSGAIQNFETANDEDPVLAVVNSTISGNSARSGGGIFGWQGGSPSPGGGTMTILNSTITGNTSTVVTTTGGGLHVPAGVTATIQNSILAGNNGGALNCSTEGGAPLIVSNGDNIETGTDCDFTAGGDLQSTDPLLGALADNGGGTDTHAIPLVGPARDAANAAACPAADQRGVARPQGAGCDIGAFELAVAVFPVAVTGPAESIGTDGALLTGTVDPGGQPAQYRFEYGTSTAYGSQTAPGTTGSGSQPVSAAVAGLESNTTYHFRLTASTPVGGAVGADGIFTTLPKRIADLPEPVVGRQTNVEPVGDDPVFVCVDSARVCLADLGARSSQTQGGRGFIPLAEARQVPIGSFLDTRRGTARVQTAVSTTRTQSGTFTSGVFQVLQSRQRRARGLTELRLKGSSFRRCRRTGRRSGAAAAQLSRRTIRRVRSNANGRFRTRGRHSAATVRGTVWTTADRCDGTLTTVRRGRVAVRDFRRKRTVIVRAGKSYLARAPG